MVLGQKKITSYWNCFRNYSLIIILILVPLVTIYYSNGSATNSFMKSDENLSVDESDFSNAFQEKIFDTTSTNKLGQNYNPARGSSVREFCKSCTAEESISKIAFSPDNRLLAGGTENGKIYIWDITTDKTRHILNNSNNQIINLEWTVDSTTLISVGQDSELNYWNVSSGELNYQINLYPRILDIKTIDLSNDGKTLAIASGEKTVSLWDINGTFVKLLTEDTISTPFDIKFAAHGSLLALYTLKGLVMLWNTSSSELIFQTQTGSLITGTPGYPPIYKGNYIDFSLDASLLFLARNGQHGLKILDTKTGNELPKLYSQEDVLSIASSKNSNVIITGSDSANNQIKLYNYKTHETILQIQDESTIEVDFSYDGTLVASVNAGGAVRLWNTVPGTELRSFRGHIDNIIQTKFLNSSIIVSSSKDNTVKVWKDNQILYSISNSLLVSPYAVAITETPKNEILVAIGTEYGKIFLFNSSQPTSLREYAGHEQMAGKGTPLISWIDFSPNSTFFASCGINTAYIKIWNSSSTDLVQSLPIESTLDNPEAYFLGNNKIIGGGLEKIIIWDLKTAGTKSYPIIFGTADSNLLNFDFMKLSPDQSMLVAAYRFNYIAILNLTDSKVRTFTINGLDGSLDFEFTPDNRYLIELSGKEQILQIWDVQTLKVVFSTYVDVPNPFNGDFNPVDWTLTVSYKQEDEIVILDMTPLKNGNIDKFDFDSDGMSDSWEQKNSLQNDNYYDRFEDPDNDQLMNWEEFNKGINSTNPQSSDTDGDGISDTYEKQYNMDPLVNDANGDIDGDGMNNLYEYQMGLDSSLNDSYFDYDNDGLTNLQEFQHQTDVHNADTDGDGMDDKWEVENRLNATDAGDALLDYDFDGITNIEEYRAGSDPNSFISVPLLSLNYFYVLLIVLGLISAGIVYYQYRKHLIAKFMSPDYNAAFKTKRAGLESWYDYLKKEKALDGELKKAKSLLLEGSTTNAIQFYQHIREQEMRLGKIHEYAETTIQILFVETKLLKGGKDVFNYLNVNYPFKGNNILLKEYNKIIDGYKNESLDNTGLALTLWNEVVESGKIDPELSLIVHYAIIDLKIQRYQVNKTQELFNDINTRIDTLITKARQTGNTEYVCGANILSAKLSFSRYNISKALEALNKVKELAIKEKLYLYQELANEEARSFDKVKDTIKKGLSLQDTALEERNFEEYMRQMKDYATKAKEMLEKDID